MAAHIRPCNDAMTTGTRLVRIDLNRPGRHRLERAAAGVYAEETRLITPQARAAATGQHATPTVEGPEGQPDVDAAVPLHPARKAHKLAAMLRLNVSRRWKSS